MIRRFNSELQQQPSPKRRRSQEKSVKLSPGCLPREWPPRSLDSGSV